MVADIWGAARDAVNQANGWGPSSPRQVSAAQVRDAVAYHEHAHQRFMQHPYSDILLWLGRQTLEGEIFNERLSLEHPFIQAIRKVVGDVHEEEIDRANVDINISIETILGGRDIFQAAIQAEQDVEWYLIEFFAAVAVETEFFGNPYSVVNRLYLAEPNFRTPDPWAMTLSKIA